MYKYKWLYSLFSLTLFFSLYPSDNEIELGTYEEIKSHQLPENDDNNQDFQMLDISSSRPRQPGLSSRSSFTPEEYNNLCEEFFKIKDEQNLIEILPAEIWMLVMENLPGDDLVLNRWFARFFNVNDKVFKNIITAFNKSILNKSLEEKITLIENFYRTTRLEAQDNKLFNYFAPLRELKHVITNPSVPSVWLKVTEIQENLSNSANNYQNILVKPGEVDLSDRTEQDYINEHEFTLNNLLVHKSFIEHLTTHIKNLLTKYKGRTENPYVQNLINTFLFSTGIWNIYYGILTQDFKLIRWSIVSCNISFLLIIIYSYRYRHTLFNYFIDKKQAWREIKPIIKKCARILGQQQEKLNIIKSFGDIKTFEKTQPHYVLDGHLKIEEVD